MKRRGEVSTALVIAILAVLIGGGAIYYYYSQSGQKTPGTMNSSEDNKKMEEIKRWESLTQEISSELASKFGEFTLLESYDFVPSIKMKWGEKTVYQVGDRYCFMIPEDFVQKFSSLAKDNTLVVARDGSRFSIDILNGNNFNLEETLSEFLNQVSDLKSSDVSSNNYVDIRNVKSEIVNQITNKSAESYGYVRFIFKTNIEDVYVIAVFSIDPNEVTHSKGRYIATGRELLIFPRARDEILVDINNRLDFNKNFYILEFDLKTPNTINNNTSVKECLEKFISEFE